MAKQTKIQQNEDIIIVGGGLAGLTMTALLGSYGISAACLDAQKRQKTLEENFDGRTTAISYGSSRILQKIGIWDSLLKDSCPIEKIEIMDNGTPSLLDFLVEETEAEAFGWIIENRILRKTLLDTIDQQKSVRHIDQVLVTGYEEDSDHMKVKTASGDIFQASLVIAADGRNSTAREYLKIGTRSWSYRQNAIVCVIAHEHPHDNIAVEHFYAQGPFAILPMHDDKNGNHRSSIVWTEHKPAKQSAIHYDADAFQAALQARCPARLGAVECISERFSYPLSLSHAHHYTGHRMALIAEAAHGIHPIAGQGLNMSMRDIDALADLLNAKSDDQKTGLKDIEMIHTVLQEYERKRRLDNMMMVAATDNLNKLFSNESKSLKLARRLGLLAVSRLGPAKKFFMKQAMGLGLKN